MNRIGVLTSGGDAPGMNAAVMAVAKAARRLGMSLIGIKRGYNGALNIEQSGMAELDLDTVLDIADQPGTYLRTARCLEFLDLIPENIHAARLLPLVGFERVELALDTA